MDSSYAVYDVVYEPPLHCSIGVFFSGTLGNASAYSIRPISDGGLMGWLIYSELGFHLAYTVPSPHRFSDILQAYQDFLHHRNI